MKYDLKYHDSIKTIEVPEHIDAVVLKPETLPVVNDIPEALNRALKNPVHSPPLADRLRSLDAPRIAIAIPDETRPAPVKQILPILLDLIFDAKPGICPDQISILIGGGLHDPADTDTQERIIPKSLLNGCPLFSHDAKNDRMIPFGTTTRGTPVAVNEIIGTADIKIAIGQIDPHQFVGFTGGSKGITVGCASPETIKHNHSLMFDDNAQVGNMATNPVRQDLNEAGRMIGIDFAVNVVLNTEKQVVELLAGEPVAVLEKGAKTCAALYGIKINTRYDIVVASCGGSPKDLCLYQAQKGLNQASHAVKKGGKILLLAACHQGIGDEIYFDYVVQFASPEEVIRDFKSQGFKMGAHKAYLFGRTLLNYDVAVFSDLDPKIMGQCHLRAGDPSNIIQEWIDSFEGIPKLAIIPYANTTYFYETA
ncbi:MAG: nickel-dependent lactate racemase [Desulfobacterales bacterium]|nr:nickel-dependent lactate racemase [Desulfobacterales bacterium]